MKSINCFFLALALGVTLGCAPDPCDCRYQEIADKEDVRETAPSEWEELLNFEDSGVRARAARGVGRVRAPALVPALLTALAAESDDAVAQEQIFALGQIGGEEAYVECLEQLRHEDSGRRARAAEALGKLENRGALGPLVGALADDEPAVRRAAALALARLIGRRARPALRLDEGPAEDVLGALSAALAGDADPELHWRVTYALSEIELDGRSSVLERALDAADSRSRLFAVRGLARIEGAVQRSRAKIVHLLDDPDVAVAASAARALAGRGVDDGLMRAARRDDSPAAFHVRRAAILAARSDGDHIAAALRDPSLSVRSAALLRAARHRDFDAPLVSEWARSILPLERVAAARAAAELPEVRKARHLLAKLSRDETAQVAAEALAGMGRIEALSDFAREMALVRLSHDDMAVRGTALGLLRRFGDAEDIDAIERAYDRARGAEEIETRAEALRAAVDLAGEKATTLLRRALADEAHSIRDLAAARLGELGAQPPAPEPAEHGSSVEIVVREDFLLDEPNPRAVIKTAKGSVELELLRDEAPRHVKNFIDFARSGRYTGLPFHRVVSGFVVQGLDPRGDGWGTGGVTLRDEINPVPYERGVVGMPNSGPDTGGCQLFITLVPTPHLDGRYTVFGRVTSGMDVVDAIDVGDVCLGVEIL